MIKSPSGYPIQIALCLDLLIPARRQYG